jgi:NTP pyrophosphatase (non-canonical NTP hydrolase)
MRGAMMTPIHELALLNTLRDEVAKNAEAHGFRDQYRKLMTPEQWEGQLGALVRASVYTSNQHGEASEFWEAFRAGKLNEPCDKAAKMAAAGLVPLTNAEEEIADEFIRILDKAQAHGVDVAKAVAGKMAYNATRPYLHGGKLA